VRTEVLNETSTVGETPVLGSVIVVHSPHMDICGGRKYPVTEGIVAIRRPSRQG
jgi:hypothetical protein